MSTEEPDSPPPGSGGPLLTRRQALKTGAGAVAGGAVLSGSDVGPLDLGGVSPTGEADAIAPIVVAGGIGAAGAGAWFLHEVGVLAPDSPTDGLGPDALQQQIYQTALKRKSYNQSTFVDTENLIKYIPEAAFSKGKLAALEAINNDATESEAINAGQQAANSHFATIEENFMKSWNESLTELNNMIGSVESHSNLDLSDVIYIPTNNLPDPPIRVSSNPLQLRDGSEMEVKEWGNSWQGGQSYYDPRDSNDKPMIVESPSGSTIEYLIPTPWNDVWSSMQSTFDDVLNNISMWVSNTYSEIQSGELSPDEYLSATDFANTIATDADQATAIGNFLALNVPGEYDHEMTVEFDDGSVYQGFLATTDTTNVPELSAGTSINPDATDTDGNALYETWYLAYRPGSYIQPIDYYDADYGIQGGTMRFTSDPTTDSDGNALGDSVEYAIETSKGEQATIAPADVTEETIDSTTYWTVDLSDQLDETIAEINRVRRIYVGENPDTYKTMVVNDPFTITEIDGTDSVTIEQHREPQTDSNYITEEEWQEIQNQQEDLIDRWEDASQGGGLIDVPSLGLPKLPGWIPGSGLVQWVIVGFGALLGVNLISN